MVPIESWLAGAQEYRLKNRRPLVTLSYAQSLDGSIAARPGVRTRLSGPESLLMTHRLRAAHDAILVGVGTLLADDPSLTVRLAEGKNPQPVVLDCHLRAPVEAKIFRSGGAPVIAYSQLNTQCEPAADVRRRAAVLEQRGARLLPLPTEQPGRVSLPALLECLADLGVASLMVEGGSAVIGSFLQSGLVDYVVLTIAPLFLAGLPAVPADGGEPPSIYPLALKEVGSQQMGEDLVMWGKVK
jgi:3,4-dihydroxy 2-butanone 4-phosphate synthase/GTP cyclohydrolase II